MPTLSPDRETTKITLPQSGGEVTIFKSLKAGDMNKLDLDGVESAEDMNPSAMASALIKEWNFTDPDGADLEPTPENVDLLDLADFTAILEEIDMGDFLDEESPANES